MRKFKVHQVLVNSSLTGEAGLALALVGMGQGQASAIVEARLLEAEVAQCLTIATKVVVGALACVVVHLVEACAAVQTRLRLAVVDVLLAIFA